MPSGGTLEPENRWVRFATLLPSDKIEEAYAPQFSPTNGAPAKPARLAFVPRKSGGSSASFCLYFAWFYAWQKHASSWMVHMHIWRLVTSEQLINA